MIRPAGMSTGFDCRLCRAGTYQTGLGQDTLIERFQASALCSSFFMWLFEDCPFWPLFMNQNLPSAKMKNAEDFGIGRAGMPTGLNCSLCRAGTYQTGSGQDALIGRCICLYSLLESTNLRTYSCNQNEALARNLKEEDGCILIYKHTNIHACIHKVCVYLICEVFYAQCSFLAFIVRSYNANILWCYSWLIHIYWWLPDSILVST
jgi:hypothetical protein